MSQGRTAGSMQAEHFLLRVARLADAGAVNAVLESAYCGLLGGAYDPAVLAVTLPAMTVVHPALLACGTYFVQEAAGGRIVACGGWTREEPGTNRVADGIAHVRHFGTHAEWIRKGLGRGIFERCRDEAVAAGVHTIRCFSSLGAEPFYASLGFRAVERVDLVFRGDVKFPSVTMVWTGRRANVG